MVTSGTGHDRRPSHFSGPEAPRDHPRDDENQIFWGEVKFQGVAKKVFSVASGRKVWSTFDGILGLWQITANLWFCLLFWWSAADGSSA